MRRLVVASAILATLLTTPLSALAASPSPSAGPTASAAADSAQATAALEYLLAAQASDGSIDKSISETADFVIAAASAGYDPSTLNGCTSGSGALAYLATASDAAATDAAKTGKTILAVIAAGEDPTKFAGRNLITRLAALYHAKSGAYGDGSTFGQAFAILALKTSGGTVPAAATTELAALQDTDGSWSYGKARVPAGGGDTNSTAIALIALDAAGVHKADATGLAYLASQQLADGGFPYQNASTFGAPASDPDSDSIVLQALLAAGQDPTAGSWSKGSNNVLTNLRAGQAADGGYAYPGSKENAFTTVQVPAGLVGSPYGAVVHPQSGAGVPNSRCPNARPFAPNPSPSPSASPTTSPSPKPTAADRSGSTGGSSGWPRRAVLLAIAGLVVLVFLIAGGWLLMVRSRRR
jgi:hypothetical protein